MAFTAEEDRALELEESIFFEDNEQEAKELTGPAQWTPVAPGPETVRATPAASQAPAAGPAAPPDPFAVDLQNSSESEDDGIQLDSDEELAEPQWRAGASPRPSPPQQSSSGEQATHMSVSGGTPSMPMTSSGRGTPAVSSRITVPSPFYGAGSVPARGFQVPQRYAGGLAGAGFGGGGTGFESLGGGGGLDIGLATGGGGLHRFASNLETNLAADPSATIAMATSMPISIPMMPRGGLAKATKPSGPRFVPPHLLSGQEDGEPEQTGMDVLSSSRLSPAASSRREKLTARNAIMRATGFLEGAGDDLGLDPVGEDEGTDFVSLAVEFGSLGGTASFVPPPRPRPTSGLTAMLGTPS